MKRIYSGVIIALTCILMCVFRGWVMRVGMQLICIFCIYEMYEALARRYAHMTRVGGYLYALLSMPVYHFSTHVNPAILGTINPMMLLAALGIILSACIVILRGKVDFEAVVASFLPIIYPGMLAALLYPTQDIGNPLISTVALGEIILIAWGGDIAAMLVGNRFGKHKLAPQLSPKKSLEGAAGGLVASILVAMVLPLVLVSVFRLIPAFSAYEYVYPPLWQLALLGAFAGIASQFGDLAASMVKRHCGIKDFGTLFPGHGGMLDRMDGVLFCTAVCYVYFIATAF